MTILKSYQILNQNFSQQYSTIQFDEPVQIITNCKNNRNICYYKPKRPVLRIPQPERNSTNDKQQIKSWNHLKNSSRI